MADRRPLPQRAGRSCPPTRGECAGEVRSHREGAIETVWSLNVRYLSIGPRHAHQRMTRVYRVTPRVVAGVGWIVLTGEVQPRGAWFITPERVEFPSVVLGAAADRLSTPEGHTAFLTSAKRRSDMGISTFPSIENSAIGHMIGFPFGGNFESGDSLVLQQVNDTDYTHAILSQMQGDTTVSLHPTQMKHPGIQLNYRF